ncbi:MAG: Xaa-Pro peptidase family protein [Candidatus Liptonbacteria bacterium]|nr:Xaa-Pro peptidase family protein [Candidatus Liptonbacteria bacterium]
MKKKIGKTAFVLWGATDIGPPYFSADILWRTGFKTPDPFFLVDILDEVDLIDFGKSYLLIGPLEVERAAEETEKGIEIVNTYDYKTKSRGYLENFLKKQGVKKVIVPDTFPCGLKDKLANVFEVTKASPPFYPKRAIKTDLEIQEIEKAQRAVEKAVKKGVDYLRSCQIINNKIIYVNEFGDKGNVATSESLRKIIDTELYRQGYLGIRSIVACGKQAANPHCEGSGPLYAHQPIVMDIFPLSMETHYWADMTRTVFKGEPSQALKNMYETVLHAQEMGVNQVRAGRDGKEIYDWTLDYFKVHGYPTNMKTRPARNATHSVAGGPMEGFIHGVGHGVGIDIHEPPWITSIKWILQEGNVVTVEPGLYYQKARTAPAPIPAGGIRIEDMVLVTKTGCRNLTQFPKDLESVIIP